MKYVQVVLTIILVVLLAITYKVFIFTSSMPYMPTFQDIRNKRVELKNLPIVHVVQDPTRRR